MNEQIFAVDVCAGISGVAVTTIRPAPPLSVGGAALALALMGLVAWRRGRRATH